MIRSPLRLRTSETTKVVFEAARRSGVMLPGGSAKDYARHLLRIQVSARHRSESPRRSVVSQAIAEAARPKSPNPRLEIPQARKAPSPRKVITKLPELILEGTPEPEVVKVLATSSATEVGHAPKATKASVTVPKLASEPRSKAKKAQRVPVAPPAPTTLESATLDFGEFSPRQRTAVEESATFVQSVSAPVPVAEIAESPADLWSTLRAEELKVQKLQHEEADRKREENARLIALQAQELEWVASRPKGSVDVPRTDEFAVLHPMYVSPSWLAAYENFHKAVVMKPNKERLALAMALVATSVPRAQAASVWKNLSAIATQHRLPSSAWVATNLRLRAKFDSEGFRQEYDRLTSEVRSTLPLTLNASGLRGIAAANWTRACELLSAVHVHDPFGALDQAVLSGLPSDSKESRSRLFEMAHAVEQRLRTKLSEVGKQHIATLMRSYGRAGRYHEVRRLYIEVQQRGDLDEAICAMMLRYSSTLQIKALFPEMKAAGVSIHSPTCVAGAIQAMLSRNEVTTAVELYKNFRERVASNLWSSELVFAVSRLATLESEIDPEEVRSGAMSVFHDNPPLGVRNALIRSFCARSLYDQALTVFDKFSEEEKTHMPFGAATAINAALSAAGRPPVSVPVSSTFDDMPKRVEPATQAQQTPDAEKVAVSYSIPQADALLELAKNRQWERAIEVLATIDNSYWTTCPSKQATLLFNCALSAAVDESSVLDRILKWMESLKVEQNTTTFNTTMSSYARDETRWSEAINTFNDLPAASRDGSSYSVALSVFGKRVLWEEAVRTFQDARQHMVKLSPVHYSLIVQAAHKDHWMATLAAFSDLRKNHGPDSVKELVTNRVLKSLELHGRTGEATKVLGAVQGKKKKA
jgi:pentatricopeptide repeat protein